MLAILFRPQCIKTTLKLVCVERFHCVQTVRCEFCVNIDHRELFKLDMIFFYSHVAMTTSKWDLLEQEEEKAPPEDLDGQ